RKNTRSVISGRIAPRRWSSGSSGAGAGERRRACAIVQPSLRPIASSWRAPKIEGASGSMPKAGSTWRSMERSRQEGASISQYSRNSWPDRGAVKHVLMVPFALGPHHDIGISVDRDGVLPRLELARTFDVFVVREAKAVAPFARGKAKLLPERHEALLDVADR